MPAGLTQYVATGAKEARSFRNGYFGMPLVFSPYEPGQKDLYVIQESAKVRLVESGLGFVESGAEPLPAPPSDPAYAYLQQAKDSGGVWSSARRFKVDRNNNADVGYQLGADGRLYWVSSNALLEHTSEGWKVRWAFPKSLADRRAFPGLKGGIIVLSADQVAVFGGSEAFVQILELGADPMSEPKVVRSVSYEAVTAEPEAYPSSSGPQFCVANGFLYAYFNLHGRLFRLNLSSGALTDYTTPWPAQEFQSAGKPKKWRGSQTLVEAPVIPEAIAFTPGSDGRVKVTALMWNMPMAVFHRFDLDSEGSSIHSDIKVGSEIEHPIAYIGPKGDPVPFKAVGVGSVPRMNASPRSTDPTDARPTPSH